MNDVFNLMCESIDFQIGINKHIGYTKKEGPNFVVGDFRLIVAAGGDHSLDKMYHNPKDNVRDVKELIKHPNYEHNPQFQITMNYDIGKL